MFYWTPQLWVHPWNNQEIKVKKPQCALLNIYSYHSPPHSWMLFSQRGLPSPQMDPPTHDFPSHDLALCYSISFFFASFFFLRPFSSFFFFLLPSFSFLVIFPPTKMLASWHKQTLIIFSDITSGPKNVLGLQQTCNKHMVRGDTGKTQKTLLCPAEAVPGKFLMASEIIHFHFSESQLFCPIFASDYFS